MCSCCSVTQKKLWVFGCGSFLAFFALILAVLWPTLSHDFLYSQLVLKPGSLNFNNWVKTPIPIYMELYLFEWANPEDLYNPDIKPKFIEKGPYVFLEQHERVNITWNANETVTFNQTRTWHFDQERSNGKLSDTVTCANLIAATAAYLLRDAIKPIKTIADYMVRNRGGSLTVTKTVKELLYDGYQDQLLDFLKSSDSPLVNIPFDKFAWFADRNLSSTYDGRFVIGTGEKNYSDTGIMKFWNGVNETSFYRDDCGGVEGTTGELWPPNANAKKSKIIFATDICRAVEIPYAGPFSKHGIDGHIYAGDESVFDIGYLYEKNKCYCSGYNGTCPDVKNGVMDVSNCRYGAPVYVSYPHYYLADKWYVDQIDGMKPDKEKHEFNLALEPQTGIPLQLNARLQINMQMRRISGFEWYENIPQDIMMPLIWFNQRAELTDDLAFQAKLALNLPLFGQITAYVLGAVGVILVIIGIILTVTKSWKRKVHEDQEPLSDN